MLKLIHNDFNLGVTLDSGQVFGFVKGDDGCYSGNMNGGAVQIWQKGSQVCVESSHDITKDFIQEYFDLNRDLSPVYSFLKEDLKLTPALTSFRGLRLIRQNSWEALVCFIISSNNNVKRIQGIWKNLFSYYQGFPTAKQIAGTHERILRELGLGYRAPFLLRTAQFISRNEFCLEYVRELPYEEAKERVLSFPGIGPKVADCVLLFGFQKFEAFPVDVWILRVMRKLYFNNRKIPEDKVHVFGQKRWGSHAGYVQQYLFHAAKNGIL